MKNSFEKTTYIHLIREFENELNRKLTNDEKEFLKWLAKKHVWELEWDRKSK